jgi:hypothetical protein
MVSIAKHPGFGPVEHALLLLSRVQLTQEDVAECREFLTAHAATLDWGRLIDLAGRHRVLPLVSANFANHKLFRSDADKALIPYHYLFTSVYHANAARNEALLREFDTVTAAVAAAEVPFAVRKGASLISKSYRDPGKRRMHDLDLLIRREDAATVRRVIEGLGYQQGRLTADATRIEPFSRQTQMHWRLHLNNALPMVKHADRRDITVYVVDLCFNLFPTGSAASLDTDAVLSRAVPVPGSAARWLAEADLFIDVCSHLFKEATTLYYIANGADIQLQKYVDLLGICPSHGDLPRWADLLTAARACGAAEIVYFALHNLSLLFPEAVPDGVLAALRPDDTRFLDEVGRADGVPQTVTGSFLDRVFADRRKEAEMIESALPVG